MFLKKPNKEEYLKFINEIMKNKILYLIVFLLLFQLKNLEAQTSLDRVVAVVGKYMVLQSEVTEGLADARAKGYNLGANGDCDVLEQILMMKLLMAQADKDSITVGDNEVENELNRRINYMLKQFGSQENMEMQLGKEMQLIKEDFRKDIHDILLAQKMNQKIAGDAKVTPAEVRAYLKSIPEDSLPLINSEVEIGEIVKKPLISEKAKKEAKEKLANIRKQVVENGESFAVKATLYSEDPGSAKNGGEYDNIQRGSFVPEFEAAAFRLKPGEISEIVETVYGFHIIQLIARKGDFVDLRHILIAPKMSNDDLYKCKLSLDSIYKKIKSGEISFCEAASKYSDEKETKMNCGLMINMAGGNTRFEIDELGQMDEKLVFMLDKMKVGEMSEPLPFLTRDQKQAYRIFYLKNRIAPHKANLKDDYQRLQTFAQAQKQEKTLSNWVNRKIKSNYIKIDPYYQKCPFKNNWVQSEDVK
jgi:peptidyl-prolyl cis-trans isomerase SurA